MPNTVSDACDLLDADHLAVKHLFVEYARLAYGSSDAESGDRAALAATICDQLTAHAQIEEEIFYPALRKEVPDTTDVVDEAKGEHAQAKALIARIRGRAIGDEDRDVLVADLARAVEDHVKVERDELFPKARATPGLDLVALGARLAQRQAELAG